MVKKCKAKNTVFTAFLSLVILIFTSCFNFFEEPAYNPVLPVFAGYASGNISISDSVSPELAASIKSISPAELSSRFAAPSNRTAFPSIPTGATVTYYAEVTASSGETWTGSADFSNLPAYSITGLSAGVLWTIEIGIKDGSNKILKDSHTMTTALSVENPVYTHDFELKPFQTTGATPGSGNLVLEIELESGSEITKCKTSLSSTDEYTPSSNKITVSKTGITSGSHTVDFTFYSTDSEVLYQFTESLNVFDNMTTNTWLRNGETGSSPYLVEETAGGVTTVKCRITNAMVQAFRMTTFYVKMNGNTEGTGTYFNPLQSIQGAITHMYNKDLDYRIFVMGSYNGSLITIPYNFTKDTSGNYHAKSLTICGYDGLDENGIPRNTIGGLGFGVQPVFNNQSNVPLVFKNLKITNGKSGISNNYSGDVTLDDGVYITGNETAISGKSFSMKGSAYIASDNAVSLETALTDVTYKIIVKGALTRHSSTDKIKVIPTSYTRSSVIVEADGTNVTDLTSVKDCFEIVDTDWYTCLPADKSKIVINAPYFVAPASSAPSGYGNGSDATGDGSRANPYESIYRVTNDIHYNNIALDYTIKVAGTITGSQHIVKSGDSVYTYTEDYSAENVINTDNAASITIIGARDLPDDGKPLDGISCGSAMPALYFSATGVPLTLKNIYLTDGCTGLRVSSSAPVYIEEGTEIKENSRATDGSYLAKGILMAGGTLYIKGGEIHDNRMSESGYTTMAGGLKLDGVTLYMSGGKIYNNTGYSGGGIANYYGTVYIYGSAIIGDENATNCAGTTNATRSNFATNFGGGIYNANSASYNDKLAKVYIGYKPNEEGNPVVDEDFTGGIYYNSASRGGGIGNKATYNNNSPEVYIAKGTIAFNYASHDGGAIYSSGDTNSYKAYAKLYISGGVIKENKVDTTNNTTLGGAVYATNFYLSGNASIPAGVTDASTHVLTTGKKLNDVYLDSGYKITITGKLTPPAGSGGITATITPNAYTDGSEVVALSTSPAPDPSTTITETSACFAVTPQVVGDVTTNWYVVNGQLSDAIPVSSLSSAPASGTKVSVSSQEDLNIISNWVNSSSDGLAGVTVKLTANITLDDDWAGIGRENTYSPPAYNGKDFCGDMDGNGKEITFNSATKPLFFQLKNANVKDVVLRGAISSDSVRGALANEVKISTSGVTKTISNVVSYCNVSSNSSNPNFGKGVGGIIGTATAYNSVGTIYERNLIIKDCVNYGNVSGGRYAGGIVGETEMATFRNCEYHGSVTATSQAGGIAAIINGQDSDYIGSVIENCCVTGIIKSTGTCSTYSGYGYAAGIACAGNTGTSRFFNCLFAGTINASEAVTPMGRGISVMGVTPNCTNCYYVGDADLQAGPTAGCTRVNSITNTEISALNDTSTITNSLATKSDYRTWELGDDGKPRLVRP